MPRSSTARSSAARGSAARGSAPRGSAPRGSAGPLASNPARVFAALGDPHRLRVVARLGNEGPLSIVDLTTETEITRQAVSKHLLVLEQAGLVSSRRDGRRQVYSLDRKRLQKAQAHLQAIADQWDSAIARLKAYVES